MVVIVPSTLLIKNLAMRSILCLLFAFFIYHPMVQSQPIACGTQISEADAAAFDHSAFRAFQRNKGQQRNNKKVSIGITVHIVETVQGAANIEIQTLYNELDAVNNFFSASGISFFYCGSPRFIQGKDIYTYRQAADELNLQNAEDNTINIYYLDNIGDSQLSDFACGISQFPWRGKLRDRFIIMQKSCSTNGTTLAHELGHYFGLFHTHETFGGRELVNGSNCDSAGDLLCDTPADPNLAVTGLSGCSYDANALDANGEKYRPSVGNLMAYSPSRCRLRFSNNQNDLMNFYLETTDLATIITDCDFYPDYSIASTANKLNITSGQILELEYTFDNEGITADQSVDIFWKLTREGEIELTIQKDVLELKAGTASVTQSFNVEFPISKGTGAYTLTAVLDPDSKIQERDKRNNFHTIDLTVDNAQFSDILLFPNPANDQLKVFARDKVRGGDITLQIVDYMGRIYYEEKKFKSGDEFFADVSIDFLEAGLYFLNVRYDRDGVSQPFLFLKE